MQVIPPADADFATLEAQRKTLAEALQTARDACIVNEVIVKGAAALRRSEARCALREQVDVVEGGGPTVTQRAYARDVNKLERLRREAIKAAEEGAELIEGGDPTGGLGALMEEADALGYRSRSEYWLYQCCTPLDAIDCADESSVRSLERLEKAIAEGRAAEGPTGIASEGPEVVCLSISGTGAEAKHERAAFAEACPLMTRQWTTGPRRTRGISTRPRTYPLPPEGGDYVWVPSEILGTYREAALRVERALDEAKTCEGNAILVEEGQLSHRPPPRVMLNWRGRTRRTRPLHWLAAKVEKTPRSSRRNLKVLFAASLPGAGGRRRVPPVLASYAHVSGRSPGSNTARRRRQAGALGTLEAASAAGGDCPHAPPGVT